MHKIIIAVGMFLASATTLAEPTTSPTTVVRARAYLPSQAYIDVTSSDQCGTSTFMIDMSSSSGRAAYANVLAALSAGKKIQVEVSSCSGWGSPVQSIYIWANG